MSESLRGKLFFMVFWDGGLADPMNIPRRLKGNITEERQHYICRLSPIPKSHRGWSEKKILFARMNFPSFQMSENVAKDCNRQIELLQYLEGRETWEQFRLKWLAQGKLRQCYM